MLGYLGGVNAKVPAVFEIPTRLFESDENNVLPASWSDLRFITQFAYGYVRLLNGPAMTVAPVFKIGTNAAHNNIVAAFSPPLTVVEDVMGNMPLVASIKCVKLLTDKIYLEVLTGAVGPNNMSVDVMLRGFTIRANGLSF